jgi:periplasmic protein TonB
LKGADFRLVANGPRLPSASSLKARAMPPTELMTDTATGQNGAATTALKGRDPEYHAVFVESPSIFKSLSQQLRAWWREPRISIPREFYRGEVDLPLSEMRPWYKDLPSQIKLVPELSHYGLLRLGRRLHLLPKSVEVPDIWQDFKQAPGSWLNSLLVHVVALTALLLPYIILQWLHPAKQPQVSEVINLVPPDLSDLPHATHKAGGGGGGGNSTPIPASKGAVPKFAKEQFTPPIVKPVIPKPILPMTPTLLGPPDLKLPQMASTQFGDPKALAAQASNGPGSLGGIGAGSGGGIGSGSGGGLGPGDTAGFGGGAYDVGGNVAAPVPIYSPDPAYSEEARKAKYSGVVTLIIVVDAQGTVRDAQVVKSVGLGLDEKALEAVRTWKFKPGTRNGVPVATRVSVEVTFRLL